MSEGKQPITNVIVEHAKSNGLGIAGFICSLVGLLFCCGFISPIGLMLSLIALTWAPRGFAAAGTILGLIGSAWLFLGGFAMITGLAGFGAAMDELSVEKEKSAQQMEAKMEQAQLELEAEASSEIELPTEFTAPPPPRPGALKIAPLEIIALRKAFRLRVNDLIEENNYDLLLSECNAHIRSDPDYARAYSARSIVWRERNESEKMLADRTKALQLLPADEEELRVELHWNVGMTLMESGKHDEALTHFDALVAISPADLKPYLFKSMTYYEMGEYDRALATANQAVDLDPNAADAYMVRANVWSALGDNEKAHADRNRMHELTPDTADAPANDDLND